MSETSRTPDVQPTPVMIVKPRRRWLTVVLVVLLLISLVANGILFASLRDYFANAQPPYERYHSGKMTASAKIARIEVGFTIMPPFTERLIETIDYVRDDDDVKGALLVINSPGGLVSDSHEIYHHIQQLRERKPVYVVMKGIAASGGYYIAMGAGPDSPIYAEPTTWTGSIGVILPHYNASELAEKIGVEADSLATGPLKDTLNPLKKMTDREIEVWRAIIDDSFERFLSVIDEGRANLDMDDIRELATGQVYTATQALDNGLVDIIGYEDEALAAMKKGLNLSSARVVEYVHPKSLVEILLGASAHGPEKKDAVARLLQAAKPQAMYLFGWPSTLLAPGELP